MDAQQNFCILDAVETVNEVLTLHMGPHYVLLNISVDFKDSLDAGAIEQSIDRLTKDIRAAHPDIKRVFIEAEARAPKGDAASA